jgi:hypothetical protein
MNERLSEFEDFLHLQGWVVGIGILLALVYLTIQVGILLLHLYRWDVHRGRGERGGRGIEQIPELSRR